MTTPVEVVDRPATTRLEGLADDPIHAQVEVISRPVPVPGTQPFDLASTVGAEEFMALAAQARLLHMSGAAPKAIREDIYLAFHLAMAGRDYGISPTAALDLIDVIWTSKGYQLSPSPQLLNGQVERLGLGKIVPFVRDLDRCVAVALEPGGKVDVRCRLTWPAHHVNRDGDEDCVCFGVMGDSEFTWADGEIAGLVAHGCRPGVHTTKCMNKDTHQSQRCNQGYVTYPKRMLWWRAAGFCADDYFPQASLGRYGPEALGAIIDAEGRAVDPATVDLPDGYQPPPTAAEKRAAADAEPTDPAELAALTDDRAALQDRIGLLPDRQRHELAERWKENTRLQAYRIPNLPRSQVRLVQSLITGFETAAKATGWDPTAARASLAAAVAALYGWGSDSPQEPPAPPTPSDPAPSPQGEASPPDPVTLDAPAPEAPIGELPLAPPPPVAPDLDALTTVVRSAIKGHLTDPATQGQRGKVVGILQGWGITDRDDRLAALERLLGHPFTTSNELTKGEAGAIIETAPKPPGMAPADTGQPDIDAIVNRVRSMTDSAVTKMLKAAEQDPGTNPRLALAQHLAAQLGAAVTKEVE